MIDYLSKVEKFFSDNYEDEELTINGSNVSILDQALRLLDLAESKGKDTVNLEISTSEELKQLFHFDETINVIEETSDKETSVYISEEEVESLSSDIEPNFGMNKTEPHFDHPGESSFQCERRKRPKTEQGHRTGSMPYLPTGNPNQFGTKILNIDNIETNRKEVIDRWTSEISLIIQTNKEKYATKESILLLFDHKTSGIVQNFIKNTNCISHNPMTVFQDMLDAIYMMFLGIDLIEDKANEQKREIEKAKCWVCSEEGHYANKCPNRKDYPQKVKLLEITSSMDLRPIEEQFQDEQIVYTLIEEPLDESSSSSSTESD
ncbi:unnamed protein product [Lactuca virosa]|uniref:CCHC-type domain-containing protein n=1 Tax=Lactuca virosa TaxID=75947 RepID=A0AAU9PUJ8_9ASTR|nr:unnamed protein product [Lactuca virosa]